MKKTAGFLIPLAVFMTFAMPGFAQTQSRIEFYGAVTMPQDKDFEITAPQSSVPLRGTQEFSAGGRGGVRLGTDGKGRWGQDFIYSYGSNSSRIVNRSTNTQFSFTSRTHQFAYNALWYPGGTGRGKTSGAFPYLTAGVGGTFHNLSQSTINEALDPNRAGLGKLRNENVLAVNAGGGIRFRINRVYGFRVDVRDYMSRAVRYGLDQTSSDPRATVFPVGGIFHQLEISFAFVYYF
jgi:hypothetical protein